MANLLPVEGARHIEDGISEYLTTSFSLADSATANALRDFLLDTEHGMFHGPYVRTRLPYAPATNWEDILPWLPSWFKPYKHQADAFRRLTGESPEPTLVVTGTGSGKTEAFLYPIINYCLSHAEAGKPGIKAIILYPMNALANDQASRLAKLITESSLPIRAGKYTGESDSEAAGADTVTEHRLIESRTAMQENPPDILLTNYKMLDELLLRPAEQEMMAKSANTLRYMVLDEFHTYDGAQGTDVALLLRRLGLFLKSHSTLPLTESESGYSLGRVVPVATSATLGSKEDPSAMLSFAETIFGRPFDASAVVTESMMSLDEWREDMVARYGSGASGFSSAELPTLEQIEDVNSTIAAEFFHRGEEHPARVHEAVCDQILHVKDSGDLDAVIAAIAQHPLYLRVFAEARTAVPLFDRELDGVSSLVARIFPTSAQRKNLPALEEFLTHVLSHIAYVRFQLGSRNAFEGKSFPGVETHMWVREVSRVDRAAGKREFRWSDDGMLDELELASDHRPWLPACYCRNCGRSGWMTQLEPGTGVPLFEPQKIREGSFNDPTRQRPLLEAGAELDLAESMGVALASVRDQNSGSAVLWLDLRNRTLSAAQPTDEDIESQIAVPVLTLAGKDAEKDAENETCPSCGASDSIRYLGSSVATLLSVALSNLFSMPELDDGEKKTLVFADSVQDAAHRAGFVQARSRRFTLRAFIRRAVHELSAEGMVPLTSVAAKLDKLAVTARERYELLPPERADEQLYRGYWDTKQAKKAVDFATAAAHKRLAFDLMIEMGLQNSLARSLSLTGAVSAEVGATRSELLTAARAALSKPNVQGVLRGVDGDDDLERWARGVVEMIRLRGGIYHEWFDDYLYDEGNPYKLNWRPARAKGVPGFARGAAPQFPWVITHARKNLAEGVINAVAPRNRFAQWTRKCLGVSSHDASTLIAALLSSLHGQTVLRKTEDRNGDAVYALEPSRVLAGVDDSPSVAQCTVCHARTGWHHRTCELMAGGPCMTPGCEGTLEVVPLEPDYYRRLYETNNPRTIVAREHTGMLEKNQRLMLEDAFRANDPSRAYTPNVLVATPTLEMGIDIGDLSTVMLSSLPVSVSSYVQRVGRAGRLTGNSLVLAVVQGRGIALPKLNEPLSVISGAVTPPAAYLSAVDILRRQFIAHLLEVLTDRKRRNNEEWVLSQKEKPHSDDVFQEHTGIISTLLDSLDDLVPETLDDFSASVAAQLSESDLARLREWALSPDGLAAALSAAQTRWVMEKATLLERKNYLDDELEKLQKRELTSSGDEQLKEQVREVTAARKAIGHRLRNEIFGEHWVSSMERYGLLPNFSLLDDSVELTINVSSQKPDSVEFDTESRSYQRGVSSALHELAPGATFYAQGLAVKVDSVDLGNDSSNIETWRLCPECSYMEEVVGESKTPHACPECGASGFTDMGQRLPVVRMRRVSADVDKSRATISDNRDSRTQMQFRSVMTCVAPKDQRDPAWFTASTGFGAQYLPRLQLRWLNLGRGQGETRYLGGREVMVPLFRVCSKCGHIDSTAGSNSRFDHRPWCSVRNEPEEDSSLLALGRVLDTQGVFLFLPELLSGTDSLAIPSLTAAIRMGFKERLGGDPDHLSVANARVEVQGARRDVLVLHDQVPGGTGYLTQFSEPEPVRELLLAAWKKISSCDCHDGARQCCPNCLLPYTQGLKLPDVSRQAAESALLKLLADNLHPDEETQPLDSWSTQTQAPRTSSESELELKFRKLIRAYAEKKDKNVRETADSTHSSTLTFRTSPDTAPWTMRPQQFMYGTIPDFYFERADTADNAVAVYLDGYTYHASERNNRVADDHAKRQRLRDEGITVWSLTWDDLEAYEAEQESTALRAPNWYLAGIQDKLIALIHRNDDSLSIDSTMATLLQRSPMTQMLTFLENPSRKYWRNVSALTSFMAKAAHRRMRGRFSQLLTLGGSVDRPILSLGDLDTMPTAEARKREWALFLQLSSLMGAGAKLGVTIEGMSMSLFDELDEDLTDTPADAPTPEPDPEASPAGETLSAPPSASGSTASVPADPDAAAWDELAEALDGDDEALPVVAILHAAAVRTDFDPDGNEIEGIAPIVAWPSAKVAVCYDEDDAATLRDAGWTALAAADVSADTLPTELTARD